MPTATNKEQTLIKACEKWLTPCHLCVYRKQCIGSFNSAGIWYLINNVIDEEWSSGEPQSSTVMRLMNEVTEIKSQSTVKKTTQKHCLLGIIFHCSSPQAVPPLLLCSMLILDISWPLKCCLKGFSMLCAGHLFCFFVFFLKHYYLIKKPRGCMFCPLVRSPLC